LDLAKDCPVNRAMHFPVVQTGGSGLPDPPVRDGFVEIWMGVDFLVDKARKYLAEDDRSFFD
jgi:hypothetical protein